MPVNKLQAWEKSIILIPKDHNLLEASTPKKEIQQKYMLTCSKLKIRSCQTGLKSYIRDRTLSRKLHLQSPLKVWVPMENPKDSAMKFPSVIK